MRWARIASWPKGLQSKTAPGRPPPPPDGAAAGGWCMPKSGDCDLPKWNGLMGVDNERGGCDYRRAPVGRQARSAKTYGPRQDHRTQLAVVARGQRARTHR